MRIRVVAALALAAALAGCGSLGGPDIAVKVYSPQVRIVPDPSWPQADWQLSIATTAANAALDSNGIAVRPTPNELQTYKGAAWSDDAPNLLETAVVAAFEDSGKLAAVTRYGGGSRGDIGLVMEVRSFESVYAGATPEAVIEVQARLVDLGGDAVVSRRFRQAVPVSGVQVPQVVDAFGTAMSAVSKDIVGWTLVEGNRLHAARAPASNAD